MILLRELLILYLGEYPRNGYVFCAVERRWHNARQTVMTVLRWNTSLEHLRWKRYLSSRPDASVWWTAVLFPPDFPIPRWIGETGLNIWVLLFGIDLNSYNVYMLVTVIFFFFFFNTHSNVKFVIPWKSSHWGVTIQISYKKVVTYKLYCNENK